jgi:Calcineurin-like phosphoesterase
MLRKKTLILCLLFSMIFPFSAHAERDGVNFIAMSDIHFTPFDLCLDKATKKQCIAFISELNQNEVENWNLIFQKYYRNTPLASYGQDTNYSLFQSFLSGIRVTVSKNENVSFAVILGDFLGHNYIEYYKLYSGDSSQVGISNFVKKTLQYLTTEIRASFPSNIEIYPVLGNNDSYIDNYNVDNPKNSSFYSDLKEIWSVYSPQIKSSDSFLLGGYYLAKTKVKGLSITALNTTPFSKNSVSKDKADIHQIIKDQLNWLNYQLENTKNQKILLISHIPFGIDVYRSLKSMKRGGDPVTFWKNEANLIEKPYLKILSDHFSSIAGIMVSQAYSDSFQILDNDLGLYSVSVPSVSPTHYNNSGFKIFTLDESNNLKNSVTYYLDRSDKKWKEFYNFNESFESQTLFIGIQSLVGKWLRDPNEVDEKYLKYIALGADASQFKSNWKYYICAVDDNLNSESYQDCLSVIH